MTAIEKTAPERATIEQLIGRFLVEQSLVPPDDVPAPTQSLIATGVIDSLGVLTIVEFIEERFDIQLALEDLSAENFDSIAAVSRLVAARTMVAEGA